MTSNTSPIFVFVPGAWHTPDTFDGIRDLLNKRGFESEAVANQSVGAADPLTGLHADISYTKNVLQKFADQGRQIVVVTHSYGGMAGLPGGVIQVVWMAAFVTPKGKSIIDILGGNWLPWMLLKNPDDGYCYSSEQETIFYHDMTPAAQQQAIANLKPHPKPSFLEKSVHEPWHEIPSFYLFCDRDQALPLQIQEAFAQALGSPDQVADGLELALKEGLQKTAIAAQ
ncbi:alpha/beta-hydrolase [Penicillium cosmopolitanum]|uniref:Alpha/beta-hydrolase n=1 Tax=Penicillium cosmopolitanum TaxID=1131564 RepID=A0A9W9W2I2_9EURO|nr:alpha/beta-hydrolase [Penicillium cosmopolitanum]KAJ5397475.1 alpha/beta-hydrolase [Penicillium cosmopolitanum]